MTHDTPGQNSTTSIAPIVTVHHRTNRNCLTLPLPVSQFPLLFAGRRGKSQMSSISCSTRCAPSWKERWFSAITSHTDIRIHAAAERMTICIRVGLRMDARTTNEPSDSGIILAAVVHIRALSDRNIAAYLSCTAMSDLACSAAGMACQACRRAARSSAGSLRPRSADMATVCRKECCRVLARRRWCRNLSPLCRVRAWRPGTP